jgi:uncharacterized caspase-like protein
MSEPRPKRYAVIVGVNSYNGSGLPSLSFCANDAEAFYEALISYAQYDPKQVALFSDGSHPNASAPTYSDILSAIQHMSVSATENDSILFFFAGHGTRDDKDSYLLTKEYRSNVLTESSISMIKANDYFQASKAKFKMRFFDACHSGRIGRRGLPNPAVEQHLAVTAEGWATLAACKEEQFAHELDSIQHGIFSFFLVKGLRGEAAIDNLNVTLDNLKVYVMDNIIELTRKLGMEQTPVFAGEQAGNLILSKVFSTEKAELSETLQKIQAVDASTLEPEADDTPNLLSELKQALETRSDSAPFVALSQDQKIKTNSELVARALDWLSARIQKDGQHMPESNSFRVEKVRINQAPLNRQLAGFLYTSKVRGSLEWQFELDKVTKYRRELKKHGVAALTYLANPEYEDVPYEEEVAIAVSNREGYPDSTVVVTFYPGNHMAPICSMVISVMPFTFGLYALCYFGFTYLDKEMQERWSARSFVVRLFRAIPLVDISAGELEKEFEEIYAQFISYITEAIKARQLTLENLGALPGASLV